MAEQKTNVMRLLEQKRISYTPHEYAHGDGAVDGVTVAKLTGIAPERIFKTLVTRGVSKGIYVFAVPVAAELDLKKAAKAVGEKSITMLHVSEINAATGYIRGGCSPIGMKKLYPTTYHESINELPGVCVTFDRDSLPEGDYLIGFLWEDTCSRQKLYRFSPEMLTVRK